jgi:lysozyme
MKTRHKVAGGGIAAGTIALAVVMYNHWEGRNYTVVHLPFDPPKVYTVCGGITNYDIPDLKLGQKFSESECNRLISGVIPRYAAPVIACVPSFTSMPPHRQAALISFAINLGPARICGTSIATDLDAGRIKQACDAMVRYVYAAGKRLQGLINRRQDPVWGERAWCLRED